MACTVERQATSLEKHTKLRCQLCGAEGTEECRAKQCALVKLSFELSLVCGTREVEVLESYKQGADMSRNIFHIFRVYIFIFQTLYI